MCITVTVIYLICLTILICWGIFARHGGGDFAAFGQMIDGMVGCLIFLLLTIGYMAFWITYLATNR